MSTLKTRRTTRAPRPAKTPLVTTPLHEMCQRSGKSNHQIAADMSAFLGGRPRHVSVVTKFAREGNFKRSVQEAFAKAVGAKKQEVVPIAEALAEQAQARRRQAKETKLFSV